MENTGQFTGANYQKFLKQFYFVQKIKKVVPFVLNFVSFCSQNVSFVLSKRVPKRGKYEKTTISLIFYYFVILLFTRFNLSLKKVPFFFLCSNHQIVLLNE